MGGTTRDAARRRTGSEPDPGQRPGTLPLTLTLLAATALGTVGNNVLTVPLRRIAEDFGVPLSQGVLVVSGFVVVLAVAMPLSGWVGDRVGRRRLLVAALAVMAVAMAGAAAAPNLPVLVAARCVQGLACAAFPPSVMGMLAEIHGPARRARTMSAWAAANGGGQALGPPLGGLLCGMLGWRAIFVVLVPVTLAVLVLTVRLVPHDRPRAAPAHWPGMLWLTVGVASLLVAVTAVPEDAVPMWTDALLAACGVVALAVFAVVSATAAHPLVAPRALVEPRFLRSAVAAYVQMVCLGSVLIAVPLYVTGVLGATTSLAGALVFTLPASMALLAPAAGRLTEGASPRWVLRAGLGVLAAAEMLCAAYTGTGARGVPALVAILLAVGAGVALVQTPAASGATRSRAGQAGAALGLFNTMRFAGTASGAAWVAVTYPHSRFLVLFGGCAAAAVLGLLASFAGHRPGGTVPAPPAAAGVTPA